MRTTLNIDDEILLAAKSLAAQQGRTVGEVVSELLKKALAPRRVQRRRNGVPVFAPNTGAGPATLELVNRLRDGDED